MTRIDLHPEDLLDRALNGLASREERARLDAHLRSCAACRLEHAVATDCRRSAAPRPDDALVLSRLRMSVTSAFQERRYRPSLRAARPRRLRVLAAAALLLFTALGAAAVLFRVYRTAPLESTRHVVIEQPRTNVAPAPAPAPSETAAPAESATHMRRHTSVAENRAAPSAEAPVDGAKEMFARANALRRQGSTSDAVQAYRALERSFPSSPEALLSRVALGRLLLDRAGDPGSALGEFNAYLGSLPHGALAEEASIGRALSLGRLGRAADERKAWERLLAEHPGSTYAARARARIQQLASP